MEDNKKNNKFAEMQQRADADARRLINEAIAGDISNKLRAETAYTREITTKEQTDRIRRSLTTPYPFGKDCKYSMNESTCYPYTLLINEVLWGFGTNESITSSSKAKYAEASQLATGNMKHKLACATNNHTPIIPNFIIGLPAPFVFTASLTTLSALPKSYWFWPYVADPNIGTTKKGRIEYECRDLRNNVQATHFVTFQENDVISLSCNDIPSIFREAALVQKTTNANI